MRNVRMILVSLVVLGFLSALPSLASAQVLPGWDFSVSGFGGGAIPFNSDIKLSGLGASATMQNMKFDTSPSFGGKLTAWTTLFRQPTGFDFGAEVDVTHSDPDVSPQTFTLSGSIGGVPFATPMRLLQKVDVGSTIVAVNLLARYPFGVSATFPNGRWHPYLGIGGGADVANVEVLGVKNTDTAGAFQALAGVKFLLTKNIGLFMEYKFTDADHSFNLGGVKAKTTLDINHLVGGVAFHF